MNKSLNDFTNITTVILFILYSIIKRFDLNQIFVLVLVLAWLINLSLIIYLIFKIIKEKDAMEKSTKNWLYFRTIANLGFIYLTIQLIWLYNELVQWVKKDQPIELIHIVKLIPNRNIHLETKVASHIEYPHAAGGFIHWTVL